MVTLRSMRLVCYAHFSPMLRPCNKTRDLGAARARLAVEFEAGRIRTHVTPVERELLPRFQAHPPVAAFAATFALITAGS